jgi:diguanylate cyclase (GGDEF)-like protein
VSRILKEKTRRIDVSCRYGGEEFAVILPGTDLERAALLAERLRSVLAESPLIVGDNSIRLTASFGVISYRGRDNPSVERLFDCADHMLFRAKMQGRNRVCSDSRGGPKPCTEITSEERDVLYGSGRPEKESQDPGEGSQEE